MANEIEGLEQLVQKRTSLYEYKKDSLKKEIDQLRDFFMAMEKDRELLEGQIKATHILCKKKLVKAEKELHHTQARLRDTENEAAALLEGKQLEMERLQKERDDAEAQTEHLKGESDFFRGYTRYLEEKVCVLLAKLHEYHQDLQKKTEEIVETRARAVDELEWVKQNMIKFEKNLIEFHNTNTQLSSEKEHLMNQLYGIKQLEAPNAGKSSEGLADAEKKLHCANQIIQGLQDRVRRLESDLEFANKRADSATSRLNEADATISSLHGKVSRLQIELQEMKEKNLEYVTEKIEADAGAQLREAAISVLRLRIYALEGDLQSQKNMSMRLQDPNVKTLTQLSPDINVEIKARPGLIVRRDTGADSEYAAAKLEAAKYQLQEDAETIKKLRQMNTALETDLQRERSRNPSSNGFSTDTWSLKKMRKLEQALAEAHERYMLLRTEMNDLRNQKAALSSESNGSERQHSQQSYLQYSPENVEDISETSAIMDQFLGKDPQYASANSLEVGDWTSDEDAEDHIKVLRQIGRKYLNRPATSETANGAFGAKRGKSRLSLEPHEHMEHTISSNKIYVEH